MSKREANGEVFIDLDEVFRQEREQVEQQLGTEIRKRGKAGGEVSDEEFETLRKELRAAFAVA